MDGRIFHVGLPRTGTTSLTRALMMLGYRVKQNPCDGLTMRQLLHGDYRLTILDELDAITDLPSACFYRRLDRVWPGSRFILTVRPDRDAWLRSCQRWWEHIGLTNPGGLAAADLAKNGSVTYLKAVMFGCVYFNADVFAETYERHVAGVREHFRDCQGDLLEMDIAAGDGWGKLCDFLGRDEPAEPFPWENRI